MRLRNAAKQLYEWHSANTECSFGSQFLHQKSFFTLARRIPVYNQILNCYNQV